MKATIYFQVRDNALFRFGGNKFLTSTETTVEHNDGIISIISSPMVLAYMSEIIWKEDADSISFVKNIFGMRSFCNDDLNQFRWIKLAAVDVASISLPRRLV